MQDLAEQARSSTRLSFIIGRLEAILGHDRQQPAARLGGGEHLRRIPAGTWPSAFPPAHACRRATTPRLAGRGRTAADKPRPASKSLPLQEFLAVLEHRHAQGRAEPPSRRPCRDRSRQRRRPGSDRELEIGPEVAVGDGAGAQDGNSQHGRVLGYAVTAATPSAPPPTARDVRPRVPGDVPPPAERISLGRGCARRHSASRSAAPRRVCRGPGLPAAARCPSSRCPDRPVPALWPAVAGA